MAPYNVQSHTDLSERLTITKERTSHAQVYACDQKHPEIRTVDLPQCTLPICSSEIWRVWKTSTGVSAKSTSNAQKRQVTASQLTTCKSFRMPGMVRKYKILRRIQSRLPCPCPGSDLTVGCDVALWPGAASVVVTVTVVSVIIIP